MPIRPTRVYATKRILPRRYSAAQCQRLREAMGHAVDNAQWTQALAQIEQAAGEFAELCTAQKHIPTPVTRARRVARLERSIGDMLECIEDDHVINSLDEHAQDAGLEPIHSDSLNAFCEMAYNLRVRCSGAMASDRLRRPRQVAEKLFAQRLSQIWIESTNMPFGRTTACLAFFKAAFEPWPGRQSLKGQSHSIEALLKSFVHTLPADRVQRRSRRRQP